MQSQAANPETGTANLDDVFSRVNALLAASGDSPAPAEQPARRSRVPQRDEELGFSVSPSEGADANCAGKFLPLEPNTLEETGLGEGEVIGLLLRGLLGRVTATGLALAEQVALPFGIVDRLLQNLKAERLVTLKSRAQLSDFNYELTEIGLERARQLSAYRRYADAAPVMLSQYIASVAEQSLGRFTPTRGDLLRAFADLVLDPAMFERVGRAVFSGKGLFLHGPPGNGKTSIAERVTQAYGQTIWIPRALSAWGEIIQLFDPSNHEEVPLTKGESLTGAAKYDRRWVRIRRPTIVVGGELTMESLEITANPENGTSEAPLQLKSNCGTLVIDDFGRQRISPAELLNRWIVPLEKRYDFLNLQSGRKIQVPFDQFIVFSTNLEPRDLVDDAFLRRIPYKIEVHDPCEADFRKLFRLMAEKMEIEYSQQALEYLIEKHYRATGRPFRFCHPRDLLRQAGVYCQFLGLPKKMSEDSLDAAAGDFFAVM